MRTVGNAILAAVLLVGQGAPKEEKAFADAVSEQDLRRYVRELVGFGPRMGGTPSNDKAAAYLSAFFKKHGVKSVAMRDGNMGCPHEEGQDFPHGEDCPFCPFWKGKQGSAADLF